MNNNYEYIINEAVVVKPIGTYSLLNNLQSIVKEVLTQSEMTAKDFTALPFIFENTSGLYQGVFIKDDLSLMHLTLNAKNAKEAVIKYQRNVEHHKLRKSSIASS